MASLEKARASLVLSEVDFENQLNNSSEHYQVQGDFHIPRSSRKKMFFYMITVNHQKLYLLYPSRGKLFLYKEHF